MDKVLWTQPSPRTEKAETKHEAKEQLFCVKFHTYHCKATRAHPVTAVMADR